MFKFPPKFYKILKKNQKGKYNEFINWWREKREIDFKLEIGI